MKKVNNIGMLIVCVLLLIFGIVMIVLSGLGKSSYEESYKENNVLIGDLYDQHAELTDLVEDDVNIEIVEADVTSCAELGRTVAQLQTNYQNLSPSENESAFLENVDALDVCFDEFSKNARVPWYSVAVPDTVHWTWKFQSTYEFASKQIEVIWLCYENDTENLLAYTTGIYNAETGLFSDIVYTMTTLGADYYYEDPTPGIDDSEIDNTDTNINTNTDVDTDTDTDINMDSATEATQPDGTVDNVDNTEKPDVPDNTVNSTQPTDDSGDTLPTAPDDIGGGGVKDIGSDRFNP